MFIIVYYSNLRDISVDELPDRLSQLLFINNDHLQKDVGSPQNVKSLSVLSPGIGGLN